MPKGTRHIITGTLLPGIGHLYFLEVIGGGSWQLDMSRRHDRLIGHLVTVEGVRSGFDLLDVIRVIAVDNVSLGSRRKGALRVLLAQLGLISSC
jgi:hypothetical protein